MLRPSSAIDALTGSLLELHRALIDVTRAEYEGLEGPIAGPGELLTLLTTHETFAWLRPLSSSIAELEHAAATGDDDGVREHVGKVRDLLKPGAPFAQRTQVLFQREPRVVMAHATVVRALRAVLPQ